MTTTSSAQEYVNEEVIISESSGGNGEVEVLVEGSGIVIIPTTTQVQYERIVFICILQCSYDSSFLKTLIII